MKGFYGVGGTYNTIDEPVSDDIPDITLRLTFPKYQSATYFTDWDANTAKKLDITFTGNLLGGATYRTATLTFPHLKYATVDAPEGRGVIPNTVEFNVLSASAAPAGMSHTTPFRIALVNAFGGDPLQAGN